jgi:hypothetical protein
MVRDEVGLALDPKLYAKRTCKTCGGEGVMHMVVLPTSKDFAKYVGGDASPKAMASKGNVVRTTRTCSCVPPRYERAKIEVQTAIDALPPEAGK